MDSFEREDFIAYRHESGTICMQDSPSGWRIGLRPEDIPAFVQWLLAEQRTDQSTVEAGR